MLTVDPENEAQIAAGNQYQDQRRLTCTPVLAPVKKVTTFHDSLTFLPIARFFSFLSAPGRAWK